MGNIVLPLSDAIFEHGNDDLLELLLIHYPGIDISSPKVRRGADTLQGPPDRNFQYSQLKILYCNRDVSMRIYGVILLFSRDYRSGTVVHASGSNAGQLQVREPLIGAIGG
jgi:hypothetical protein